MSLSAVRISFSPYAKAHCSQMGPYHTFKFESQSMASGHLTKEQPPRRPWDSQGDREAMFPLVFSISGSENIIRR